MANKLSLSERLCISARHFLCKPNNAQRDVRREDFTAGAITDPGQCDYNSQHSALEITDQACPDRKQSEEL